jgi:periplasmic protein TonB
MMKEKNSFIIILIALMIFGPSFKIVGQNTKDTLTKPIDQQVQFATVVEEPPVFPGGQEALEDFISKNLVIPQLVKEKKLKGKTFLKLGIYADGTVVIISVLKTMETCSECDQAALDLIKLIPKWTPAKLNGIYLASYWNLPIEFSYKK